MTNQSVRGSGRAADRRAATLAALAGVVALLALRLPFLDDRALWIDEAFSLYHARHSLADLWGTGWELESSPPLYYSAIWAWTRLFGEAEPVARALSLLFTALAALCLYSAAGTLGGRRAGAVAAILFLCQPLVFQYSLEVRPYGLLCFLVAAALAAFSKALADLEQNNLGSMGSVVRTVAPIIAAGALATYTHATAPAVLAAMIAAAAAYGVLRGSNRMFWVVWLLSGCVVLLAIAPQLRVMFGVLATNERGIAWISTPGFRWVYGVLRSLAVGEHSWGEIATKLVGSSVICVIAWSIWRLRDRPLILAVGLILPAAGFAVLWVVSWWQPVLMPRTALWLVAPLCILAGCGISTVQRQGALFWMPVAVLVLSLAMMSVKNMKNRTEDRPWPGFLSQQQRDSHPGDEVVAVDKEVLCVVDYYAVTEAQRTSKRWRLEQGTDQAYRSHQRIPLGCNETDPISVADLSGRLAQGIGIWLLAGDELQRRDVEAVLRSLGDAVTITHRYDQRNRTLVWRLARK